MVAEQTRHPLFGHDERAGPIGRGRRTVVRHIADPPLSIPGDTSAVLVPGSAFRVSRGPVVQHPTVRGPTERPVVVHAKTCRVVRAPVRHHVARLGIAARVDPVPCTRATVGLELSKRGQQLARSTVVPVDLFRQFDQGRLARIQVVPREILDRLVVHGVLAVLLVQLLHPPEQFRQHVGVGPHTGWRVDRLLFPLCPPPTVGERAVSLDPVRGRHVHHLGLHLGRIHPGGPPELGAVEHERVDDHFPLEPRHRLEQSWHVGTG